MTSKLTALTGNPKEAFDDWYGLDGGHVGNPREYQTFKAGYVQGINELCALLEKARKSLMDANKAISQEHVTLVTEEALAAIEQWEGE